MSSNVTPVNVSVPFNDKRLLLKALSCSVILLSFLCLLVLLKTPESSPYKLTGFTIAIAFLGLFSVYYWTSYLHSKRNYLHINENRISWVNKYQKASVKWSFIREVNIVDLSQKFGRSKYVVYDFVLDARESALPSPMTLYAIDYQITHPELLELIEQAAKKYNFQVILERI